MKFEVLCDAFFQDFNMSNQLARKYKNEKLQILLAQILQDIKTEKLLIETPPFGFQEEIENLMSGKTWENDLKKTEKTQPPLLKLENCY